MAMSKRDTKILYFMVIILLGYAIWTLGINPVWSDYQSLSDDLQKETEKYSQNQKTLAEARTIEEGYKRVEAQFPKDDPDRDPGQVFNEEVVNLVKDTMGSGVDSSYKPPDRSDIKGASGYEFLNLPLTVRGTLPKIATLIKAFDQKGYLIQSAAINRNSDLNKDDITAVLQLGRIVKVEDEPDIGRPGMIHLNRGGSKK